MFEQYLVTSWHILEHHLLCCNTECNIVICYPLRFGQGESIISLCCLTPRIKSMIVPNILILIAHPYCSVDRRSLIVLQHGKTKEGFYRESQNQSLKVVKVFVYYNSWNLLIMLYWNTFATSVFGSFTFASEFCISYQTQKDMSG